MRNNFLKSSATIERISLIVLTITGCFLVYLFLPAKHNRDCGPRIVKVETFYNPGAAPWDNTGKPSAGAIAVRSKTVIRTGKKKKQDGTVASGQEFLVLFRQRVGGMQAAAVQFEDARQELLESQLELQATGAELNKQ